MKNNHRICSSVLALFKLIVVLVLMVGTAGSVASSYAVSLTWTNGSGDWTSTTAWQTNVFDIVTNQYTYFYTNTPLVVTNFCTITNTVTPGTFITIITNCAPGGVDATYSPLAPVPGFSTATPRVGGTGGDWTHLFEPVHS